MQLSNGPPKRSGDLARHLVLVDGVIHRREDLADVGLEHIAESSGELSATINRSVRCSPFAAGKRVGNESRCEDRFQHGRQRMMHDAVSNCPFRVHS